MDLVSGPATLGLHHQPPQARRTLLYYRDLVLTLLGKEFKVRYKSTILGYAWSVMHPLAFGLVLYVLFKLLLARSGNRIDLPAYSLYLIAGLFPWQWISNTVASSNFYFVGNSSLIKKVSFNRAALVLAGVSTELTHFLACIPVVLTFMLVHGRFPMFSWLWMLPLLIVTQLAMCFGLALVIATCNLFFRDLERLSAIAMNLLFYLTPIVFPADKIPDRYRWLLYANPWGPITVCWQGLFYYGHVPLDGVLAASAWAFVWLGLGWLIYSKTVWRFAEIV